MPASRLPVGQFALTGPSEKLDASRWPVRGDLAHVALAGRLFVPHYAVPQPRPAHADASLRKAPRPDAEVLRDLSADESFDVLDIQGDWAWGICNGLEGPVGYVRVDQLKGPAQ